MVLVNSLIPILTIIMITLIDMLLILLDIHVVSILVVRILMILILLDVIVIILLIARILTTLILIGTFDNTTQQ